jgi:hypothetical protein
MAPVPPARSPGSMTVSFLFGWQHILTGLVLLLVLVAIFLLVLAAGRGGRSEWRAFLDARSPAEPDVGEPDLAQPDLEPAEDPIHRTAPDVSRPRPR